MSEIKSMPSAEGLRWAPPAPEQSPDEQPAYALAAGMK